jgi:subtilisin family serine protease
MNRKPRTWITFIAVVCAMAVVLLFALPGAGAADSKSADRVRPGDAGSMVSSTELPYRPGEVIVKFKDGVTGTVKNEAKRIAGAAATLDNIGPQGSDQTQLLKLDTGVTVEEAVASLQSSGRVAYAEPNFLANLTYTPDDPSFGNQWGLNNTGQTIGGQAGTDDADIDAPEAWDLERGGAVPPTVAVIDTGIDATHPDLDSKDVTGYNWAGISQCHTTSYWTFGDSSSRQKFAQSIKGTGQKLTHVGIVVAKAGSPSNGITVSVRSSLNGSDLASFSISPSGVTGYGIEVYKKLSKDVILKNGTTYYLVFRTANLSTSNFYGIWDNMESYYYNTYADGCEYQYTGSSWKSYTGDDFYFRTNPNSNPRDDRGHGTHVSGIIGAETNNATGVAGVCPGAKIMPLKVFSSGGGGAVSDFNAATHYAADHGAKIINMSYGGSSYSQSEQDAINYAYNKGVVIFASSGNTGDTTMQYPAGYDHVIGVGATTNQDKITSFSTYNSSVDVSAPGQDVYSTMPTYMVAYNNAGDSMNYCFMSGTSMACPMAAGLGALMVARSPILTQDQVEQLIQNNAEDRGDIGRDDSFGYGRINAYSTLNNTTPTPGIRSITPTSDYVGTKLTIKGAHFGSPQGTSYVRFGSTKAATYYSWSDSTIEVKVPSTIYKTVSVAVRTSAGPSNTKTFKVKPKITSISPTSGKRGSKLTITGSAFGSTRGTSYAKFGSKKVSTYYSPWGNNKVMVKVPSGISGTVAVKLTTSGGTSNAKNFTVKK